MKSAIHYGSDGSIIDPARVCRLPGFDHQKRDPFRSHIIESIDPEDVRVGNFERPVLSTIIEKHPAKYHEPTPRADAGRSETPFGDWDNDANIERAREYLKVAPVSIEGDGGNDKLYQVCCKMNDFGMSPAMSLELLDEDWNGRCEPPWSDDELKRTIHNASTYKQNSAGSNSVTEAVDDFDDDDDFNFEGKPSTIHNADGLKYRMAGDIVSEKISWLWPGRFAYGKLSMIAGFPDQGKSQITLNIAAIVSKGGDWPNNEGKAEQGAIIILSAEDDAADTLVPRLIAAGADVDQCVIPESMVREVVNGKKIDRVFNLEDDLNRIKTMIDQRREHGINVRLVILDPINAYLGGKTKGDAHKTSDMRALLTPVSKWAARLGVAVIAISHFNKGGNAHTLYRVTDSGAITAVARAVWFAVRDEMTDRMMMLNGKNNLAANVPGLAYLIEEVTNPDGIKAPRITWDGTVTVTAEEALGARKEHKSEARDDAKIFLANILKDGPRSVADIRTAARASMISEATLRRAKEDLEIVATCTDFQGEWIWSLKLSLDDDFEESCDDTP